MTAVFADWMLLGTIAALCAFVAVMAWSRGSRIIGFDRSITVAPNLVLIAIPTVLAAPSVSVNGGIYAIAALIIFSFAVRRPYSNWIEFAWPALLLPLAALAIISRPNYPSNAANVFFFAMGCVVVARAVHASESRISALVSLIDGIGLFLAISVVLWLSGMSGAPDRTVGLENSLTGSERVVFPLSTSLAATPAMAAIYISGVIPILVMFRRFRPLRFVGVVIAVGIFVLSDSRMSLIAAIFLATCVLLAPRIFRLVAPSLIVAFLIVPLVYSNIQAVIGRAITAASEFAPWLIRPGENASSLNRRDYIWAQSLDFYWSRTDWIHQAVGFGSFGHAKSGASAYYSGSFGGLSRDDRLLTPHNSLLQILFDGGWLGAGIFAAAIVCMGWILSRLDSPAALPGLAMLTAIPIVAITEVAISPSHSQPTWWALLAINFIVFSRDHDASEERTTPAEASENGSPNSPHTPMAAP